MSLLVKGVTEFLKLTDTPASYVGESGDVPKVKGTEDGLEFAGGKPTFTKIYDGAVPSTGNLLPLGKLPYGTTSMLDFFTVVHGDYFYVGGGHTPVDIYYDEFYRLNLTTGEWKRLADLPGRCEIRCQAAYYNGKIYVTVRDSPDDIYNGYLFCYDVATDSWSSHDLGIERFGAYMLPTAAKLYIISTPITGNSSFDEVDYGDLDTKTARASLNGNCRGAAVVSDTVYIFDYTKDNSNYKLLEYNTVGDSWDDTGFTCAPTPYSKNWMDIEDRDYMWVVVKDGDHWKLYRSDCAHDFVEQVDMGETAYGTYYLQRSGETDMYVFEGATPIHILPDTHYGIIKMVGVWELCSQAFGQGDFLIVDAHGVPVNCSVGDAHKVTISGYSAQIIIAAETWDFKLSKDYDYSEVDIWRAYYE